MDVTWWTILMAGLAITLGYGIFVLLQRVTPKGREKGASLAFVGRLLSALAVIALVCVATIPDIRDYIMPAAAPVPGVPVDGITVGRIGLVLATVEDKLQMPRTLIEGADIYVSTTQPVPRGAWTAVASGETDASGSAIIEVRGLTSGMVYVTAWTDGYYADFTTAVIPGAEVLPTVPAAIRLEAVPSEWMIWVTDASDSVSFDDVDTITLNTAISTSGYFTLNISTPEAFTALRNIRLLQIRGDDWATIDATLYPAITNNGGTVPVASGDPTLTTSVVGGYDFTGSLVYGQVIQIRYLVSGTGAGSIARASLDDLLGSTGYVNEPGVDEAILYILAV